MAQQLHMTSLGDEWPFTIQLLDMKNLIVDPRYQRPPQEVFIERIVSNFDDQLVGPLDVSERESGYYAILDGAQRYWALEKVGKTTAWAAVYEGMKVRDEAAFFYKKNKERRSVHPYYSFRAKLVSGDSIARQVDLVVREAGFKLHVNARPDDHLAAIKAIEDAYGYSSAARSESLSPALEVIGTVFYGALDGKSGEMIRGLGRFFQPFYDEEIDKERLFDVLAHYTPKTIIQRAKEATLGHTSGYQVAKEIMRMYNRGLKQGKLQTSFLSG